MYKVGRDEADQLIAEARAEPADKTATMSVDRKIAWALTED